MIMCNYSMTKTLLVYGTMFSYPSKHDTVLNSLCFAGRRALGVILLHNLPDEREEKYHSEDTGRWQKISQQLLPKQLFRCCLRP